MRVLLVSDLHLGITKEKAIKKLFQEAEKEAFDLIINCGDNSGERNGFKATRAVVRMMRKFWPNKPILTVLSNHDYWTAGTRFRSVYGGYGHKNPSFPAFIKNYQDIVQMYQDFNCHLLDEKGPYSHPDFPDIKFIGACGWYTRSNPPTKDIGYLPLQNDEGVSPHMWLLNKSEKHLQKQFDQLDKNYNTSDTVCFVSHFPVIKSKNERGFEDFCWSQSIGNFLISAYNCKYFFEGHSHKRHFGPLKYNCGSDYYNPKYLVVDII